MSHRFFHALSVIIVVLGVILSGSSSRGDQPSGNAADKSADMAKFEKTFVAALTRTSSERRENNATWMTCSWFFYDFSRVGDDIEPYKKFLESKDLEVIEVTQNQRHYVYTTLSYKYLLLSGYFGFRFGDRLIISFTTASSESSKITSFDVTLRNDRFF